MLNKFEMESYKEVFNCYKLYHGFRWGLAASWLNKI